MKVFRMDMDGSNFMQLTKGNADPSSSCSPDGKWVAYTSVQGGNYRILRVGINGGEPVQLTSKGFAGFPVISPDGKWIACLHASGPQNFADLGVLPASGGAIVKTFPISNFMNQWSAFHWTPDGRSITYLRLAGNVSNIWSQPLEGGPPKQWTDFKSDLIFNFAWSPDGRKLVLSRGVDNSDVVMIRNFR